MSDLLKQVRTTAAPAVTKFSAKEHFKRDTSEKAKVRIGYLGDNFKKYFLSKEENIPASDLIVSTLTKASLDAPILAELGDRAETSLAHLWHLLLKQPNGESGILLTNGSWNIFYIKDAKGNLWAVGASWFASCGGWSVDASSVVDPVRWSAGFQVVSRK